MLETLALTALIYLIFSRKKRKRRLRGLDAELQQLIESDMGAVGIGLDIKEYLLKVIRDDKNGVEKFSDAQISEAQRIINRAGPSAFYWMAEIATQLAHLSQAHANGDATNVEQTLGYQVGSASVTSEQIVNVVVRV